MSEKDQMREKLSKVTDQIGISSDDDSNSSSSAMPSGIDTEKLESLGEAVGRRLGGLVGRQAGGRIGRRLTEEPDEGEEREDSSESEEEESDEEGGEEENYEGSEGEDGPEDGGEVDENGEETQGAGSLDFDEISDEELQSLAKSLLDELEQRSESQ